MNKLAKIIVIIGLLIIFTKAFTSSYTTVNLDNLAVVVAMAIDTSDTNNLQVSFQFTDSSAASEQGTSEKSKSIVNTINASSISSAINLMNSYIGKELSLSHCKLIVFSEDLATQGISDEIFTLMNDNQIRPSTNIVISKCTAKFYIENSKPVFEPLITKYYEVFNNSTQSTGYTPDATIGSFFNEMLCKVCQPYAILGGINSEPENNTNSLNSQKDSSIKSNESNISGNVSAENIGLAVFKDGKMVGELNAIETLSFLATKNQVNGFLVSIPNPEKENTYIDVYLSPTKKTKIKVDLINGSPYVRLNYDFHGRIYSMTENSHYLDESSLSAISESCNKYLESTFSAYLYKTAKEFKTDINGIGKSALSKFLTTTDLNNYNWNENYKNCFFSVDVNANIKSGSLLLET